MDQLRHIQMKYNLLLTCCQLLIIFLQYTCRSRNVSEFAIGRPRICLDVEDILELRNNIHYNWTNIASILGISRATVYRRLSHATIERISFITTQLLNQEPLFCAACLKKEDNSKADDINWIVSALVVTHGRISHVHMNR